MIFEGIQFNDQWVASKSLTDFKDHERHHGLTDDQYKEVHEICKKLHAPKQANVKAREKSAE